MNKSTVSRYCSECNADITNLKRRFTCSEGCSSKRNTRRNLERYHSVYKEQPRRSRANYSNELFCQSCHSMFLGKSRQKFCSKKCQSEGQVVHGNARRVLRGKRYLMSEVVTNRDYKEFKKRIRQRVLIVNDCWVWQGYSSDGYPQITIDYVQYRVHRLMLEMKFGAPLGVQHAHHMCANSLCVNPAHLQPVTHRENVAEMLARRSYIARIAELENVVKELSPDHPVLVCVPFGD